MREAAPVHDAAVIDLSGSPFERGRGQAEQCPGSAQHVREAVERRLAPVRHILDRPRASAFLRRQWDFTAMHDPDALAEIEGIAAGYGLRVRDVFASLHTATLLDLPADPAADGCSVWAIAHCEFGALLAKNRDLAPVFRKTQALFRHRDPAWNGRTVLCVGSLGSPGAYSSGINSDGLALADTQIRTDDHGVGLLRYFAMTRVLSRCAAVGAALEELRALRHAGGGSLILADADGAIAAVELGHRAIAIEQGGRPEDGRAADRVARTNHFMSAALRDRDAVAGCEARTDSVGRLRRLRAWLDVLPDSPSASDAMGIMASHGDGDGPGLCRHGDGAATVSGSVFACGTRRLYFIRDYPCSGAWATYAAGDGGA